ncbi:MAG: hypothetical protein N2662_12270 [Bacteroidales bacterium]|nr:hypothetical protein [Bacteroidales bacterium]
MDNPVLFNALKHHWYTIKKFSGSPPLQWIDELVVIGHSIIDLYIGKMTVEQITEEVIKELQRINVFEIKAFEEWLKQGRDFRIIKLSDGSFWTLRRTKHNETQYIHIHPGRYSPHTMRVKSETLKTAIAYQCLRYYGELNNLPTSLRSASDKEITQYLNYVRQKLQLSPVKKYDKRSRILGLIDEFLTE